MHDFSNYYTDAVPAPNNVRITDMDSVNNTCTIAWDPDYINCPGGYYYVNASNCDCPSSTTNTTVTCSGVKSSCAVSIQRIACNGEVLGELSRPIICDMKSSPLGGMWFPIILGKLLLHINKI